MTTHSEDSKWKALVLLSLSELLGMSLWFSASAALPYLQSEWNLTESGAAWMTLAVQIGFVAGTLLSALINLPDIVSVRVVFALASASAAGVNAALALWASDAATGIVLRFFTGFFLAAIYPPGMKLMASWFRSGRGMAIGVLVGALTLGKASPYLINSFGASDWRKNTLIVSALALAGGLIVLLFVREGPFAAPNARFDPGQIRAIFANRGVRLANLGYFGHMWELYAMWTWAPVMIRASLQATGNTPELADFASFLVLGAGAAGCVAAGLLADRVGRTLVASAAMVVSGACCLIIGFLYGSHPLLLMLVATVWGASVVADSAQFSACVTELGDPQYIGTALTLQTSLGFLLTTLSVRAIPEIVQSVGWRYVFIVLAPGPIFGVVSMMRLRSLPEAARLAQGRR